MSNPEEDKARIGGERGDWEFEKLLPGDLCVLWVDEDHVELARVQRAELGDGEERGSVGIRANSGTLEG